MEKDSKTREECANIGCGRPAAPDSPYCDNCGLEWALYRRDLRDGDREEEGLAVESR